MGLVAMEPDISCAALIVVDMQNDFLHPDGAFGQRARRQPERLAGTGAGEYVRAMKQAQHTLTS
jgi:nicotinamidase-related amidase